MVRQSRDWNGKVMFGMARVGSLGGERQVAVGLGPDAWGLAVMDSRELAVFGPLGYGMDRTGKAVRERHAQDGNCMVCSGSPGVYG